MGRIERRLAETVCRWPSSSTSVCEHSTNSWSIERRKLGCHGRRHTRKPQSSMLEEKVIRNTFYRPSDWHTCVEWYPTWMMKAFR